MIKAIETFYKGYRFRSRLEARWAVLFDSAGIEWVYEQEGYQLSNGQNYLPDFWLPGLGVYAEVKAGKEYLRKSFYLAGKMTNWRDEIMKEFNCKNPFFPGSRRSFHMGDGGDSIVGESLAAIEYSDFVFAYISTDDCFGTIAEIGYAVAKDKPTYVAIHEGLVFGDTGGHGIYLPSGEWAKQDDVFGHTSYDETEDGHGTNELLRSKVDLGECWFAATMAGKYRVVANQEGMNSYFKELFSIYGIQHDEQKSAVLANDTSKTVVMLRDIPDRVADFVCFSKSGVGRYRLPAYEKDLIAARSARFEFNR